MDKSVTGRIKWKVSNSNSFQLFNQTPEWNWSTELTIPIPSNSAGIRRTKQGLKIDRLYSYIHYLTIVAAVLGFSLLTNPFSLIILVGLLAAWLFIYLFRPSEPLLVIFGRTFSERETLGLPLQGVNASPNAYFLPAQGGSQIQPQTQVISEPRLSPVQSWTGRESLASSPYSPAERSTNYNAYGTREFV